MEIFLQRYADVARWTDNRGANDLRAGAGSHCGAKDGSDAGCGTGMPNWLEPCIVLLNPGVRSPRQQRKLVSREKDLWKGDKVCASCGGGCNHRCGSRYVGIHVAGNRDLLGEGDPERSRRKHSASYYLAALRIA